MKIFLVTLFTLVLSVFSVIAQTSTGSLTGTVSGSDGLIPGATVIITDLQTNRERAATTNGVGEFKVANLEVGSYTVKVTATGFKTYTATDVRIETGRDYSLPITLELGSISESVTVTAGEDLVNSTDAKISSTITGKQITDLPLNGRNPLNLITLQAGTASNPSQGTVINGVRTSGTNITIDGINVQDNFIRANATDFSPARPSVDDVAEFTLTTQAGAEDGIGGAQVRITTPRGQNGLRGTLFAFNRNARFGANDFFRNANRTLRPFRNRNQFGGNVSGPVLKDRLFFFGSYEKLINRRPSTDIELQDVQTVLTTAARTGLFTYTAAAADLPNGIVAGQLVTVNLLNPVLGTGITQINSIIQSRFLSRLPQGNSNQAGDQRNTTGFVYNQNSNEERTNFSTRFDYDINDKNSVRGSYRLAKESLLRGDVDDAFNISPTIKQPSDNKTLSLGYTSNFFNNFSNELVGGFFFSVPEFNRLEAPPSAFVTPTLISNPDVTFLDQGRTVKTYNIQNNSTYILGNHTMRFGLQYQNVNIDAFNNVGTTPTFVLGTNLNTPQISTAQFTNTALFPGQVPTAQRATANALLALLGGIVSSGSQQFNVTSQDSGFVAGATQSRQFKYNVIAPYFADQWRVFPELTLTLGLRYDLYTGLKSVNGLALEPVIPEGTDPLQAVLDPNGRYQFIGGNIGQPGRFYRTDKNNFAPNLGFAYSPNFSSGFGKTLFGEAGQTVLRGGYRISYINDELVRAPDNALLGNQGLALTNNAFNPVTGTTALNARVDNLPTIAASTFVANRTYALNNQVAGFQGTVFAIDPKLQSPLVQEYSFGLQREIGFNTAVEFRYVGTRSNNLLRGLDFNQVDIFNNGFLADFNRARSNFLLTGNAACMTAGCQALTVFPQLASGGLLTNAAITNQFIAGTPADLAVTYIINGLSGNVRFLPNPNTFVADILGNYGEYNYNAFQTEVRRRFSDGFRLQANYTFSKNLTNAVGTAQARFEPNLDNNNPNLEFSRADYDQTHSFNLNTIYELPFGKGKPFLSDNKIVDFLLGGFQVSSILRIGSGAPITFTDARGTLNRAGRSGRQTALTGLTKEELKKIVGVFKTDTGVFFIDPTVLGRDPVTGVLLAGRSGRGADGFGSAPFAGQIFFNNLPGQTSGLERAIVNGPTTVQLDMSFFKGFKFGERYNFRVQADFFNILNRANFIPAQFLDINGTNFGRITSTSDPRIIQFGARFSF